MGGMWFKRRFHQSEIYRQIKTGTERASLRMDVWTLFAAEGLGGAWFGLEASPAAPRSNHAQWSADSGDIQACDRGLLRCARSCCGRFVTNLVTNLAAAGMGN
jgi:hypothetical protein